MRLLEVAAAEEEASQPYLETARRAPGAIELESGLILTVLEEGEGESPDIFDWVVARYTGTLRDGTVFDASGEEPLKQRLGVMVTCWQEALSRVAPGARLHIVCPPSLGYRHTGVAGRVPGGAVITFEIELLEVIEGEDPSQSQP
jgi:FKBP-type peptidyl-prolyl cis-trans isomerase